jgi:hypothetical protein
MIYILILQTLKRKLNSFYKYFYPVLITNCADSSRTACWQLLTSFWGLYCALAAWSTSGNSIHIRYKQVLACYWHLEPENWIVSSDTQRDGWTFVGVGLTNAIRSDFGMG